MKIAGFGCTGCGLLLALAGCSGLALAVIPGVVNSSEQGTAMALGGALCSAGILPFIIGAVLVLMAGKKED